MKISLLEFSVENFKIFKEKATFSMFARKSEHTFQKNGQNLLKTSLIFGPNASGKSSLLNAFTFIRNAIINSTNNQENSVLPYQPFMLGNHENKPIFFEVIFLLGNKIFQYNFSYLKERIITENLLEISSTGKEKVHFKREEQKISVFLDFKKSKDVANVKTRKEVLFLSAASQWNNDLAMKIVEGFKDANVISGPESSYYRGYTIKLFKDDQERKTEILDFLKKADFCIEDGAVEKMELPEFVRKQIPLMPNTKNIPNEIDTVFFSHGKFDAKGKKIGVTKFNLGDESAGTQKFFDVLGPIVDTLKNGKVLFIDEFDNSLHPLLTKFIVDLFEKNNSENAQLIVTTHDTSLLSYKELNKEQFWFTEKDKHGAAKIFSLAEFDVRNDIEFSKKYLEGRFGALPFIDFEN
jgi:AAA15 family ATPase/GTPase